MLFEFNVVETDAEEEEDGVKPLIDSKFSCNVYEATHTLHHGIAPHDNNNHTGLWELQERGSYFDFDLHLNKSVFIYFAQ